MKSVLIVDDDLDLADMLVSKFVNAGWLAEARVGGNAAISRAEKGDINLIISDLRMPNGTGIELLRKLRNATDSSLSKIPVIIMTGLLDSGESYLKALGARRIFLKPISWSQLLEAAESLTTPSA